MFLLCSENYQEISFQRPSFPANHFRFFFPDQPF